MIAPVRPRRWIVSPLHTISALCLHFPDTPSCTSPATRYTLSSHTYTHASTHTHTHSHPAVLLHPAPAPMHPALHLLPLAPARPNRCTIARHVFHVCRQRGQLRFTASRELGA